MTITTFMEKNGIDGRVAATEKPHVYFSRKPTFSFFFAEFESKCNKIDKLNSKSTEVCQKRKIVEEQKCTPVRSQKKLSNEQNANRSKGTNESVESDDQKGKRLSNEKGAENEPPKETNEPIIVAQSTVIVVADGEAANEKVGVDVEADAPVAAGGAAIKTTDDEKETVKTVDQEVHSEPTEKKEKRKKKKKAKSEVVVVKGDENNAIGQICADDDMSFDEKKEKKKKASKDAAAIAGTPGGTEKKKKKDLSTHGGSNNNAMLATAKRQRKTSAGGVPEEDRTKEKKKKDKETSARVRRRRSTLPSALPSADKDSNRDQDNTKTKKRRERKDGATGKSPTPQLIKKDNKQEGFFKTIFNKAKSSITSKLNKSDDTFVANPDAPKTLDVRPEYGGPEDYGTPPEKPVENFDNSGHLFMKGRPFWCMRDEKPPPTKHYVMTTAMKDLTEGKWAILQEEPQPKDLDAFLTLEVMQARDADYFKKDKRILSNTIRSLVGLYDYRNKKSKNSESSKDSHAKSSITFVAAKQLIQYNRKNRFDPSHPIAFTPGIAKKVRKASASPGKK